MELENVESFFYSGACLRNFVVITAIPAVLAGLAWLICAIGAGVSIHDQVFAFRFHASEEERLQKYFQSFCPGDSANNTPCFAVLVKKDGKTIFEKGYGVRDLRTKTAVDAQTNFRLASFTKQFTAMAVMLLVREGKLRYDQSLTDIFPEFPVYGKQITVRNLLNHTGGLPDYEDLMDAAEKSKGPIWSAEKQIQDSEVLQLLVRESHGKFAAGTKWEYSNSGYVVLGLIVAKISGKTFGQFLQERIFTPLKMDHTLIFEKGKNQVVNRAYGHSKKSNCFHRSRSELHLRDAGRRRNLFQPGRFIEMG